MRNELNTRVCNGIKREDRIGIAIASVSYRFTILFLFFFSFTAPSTVLSFYVIISFDSLAQLMEEVLKY